MGIIIVSDKLDPVTPLIETLQQLPTSSRIKSIFLIQGDQIPHNLALAYHVTLIYSFHYHYPKLSLSLFALAFSTFSSATESRDLVYLIHCWTHRT